MAETRPDARLALASFGVLDPPATFMYMTTVGVAELRQNLSKYLRLVERGERLVVTDRNRPVAELGPPPS
ncbi:MAG: type II toxin-antitoxin system prevent-host-death family antitoxin, partial [Solirubrobacteraceae bacterium]